MEESQSPKCPGAPPTSDRRLNPRFPVKPIEYVEIGPTNGGIILDISREGMALCAAQAISSDQTLHFRFQLPRFPETIEATAEITWIGETRKRAGFRFVNLLPRPRKQILDWITLQNENAAPAKLGAVSQEEPKNRVPHTSPSRGGTLPSSPNTTHSTVPAVHQPETPSNGKRPPVDRRSQFRKPLHSSAYLQFDDGNAGLLGDLSVAGLSFRAARALSNDEVVVTFQLPGSDHLIEAPAAIVWKSASGKKAGARFTSLPHEAKNRISDWIHSRIPPASAPATPDSSSPTANSASVNPTSIPTDPEPEYAPPDNGHSIHLETFSPDLSATAAAAPAAKFEPPQLPPPPTFRTSMFETTSPRAAASTNLVTPVALPPLFAEPYSYVTRKESPSFLKILGAMILLGGICFGAGFFYSRNHQTLLPDFATANSEPRRAEVPNGDSDAQRASANPLSASPVIPAPSEDPAVRDSAASEISNSPEANPSDQATSQFQNTQTATQSLSSLSTSSQPNSSKADVEPSPSARTSPPRERAARDTASDLKSPATTSRIASPFVPSPTSTASKPSTATSTPPSYRASNSTPNYSQQPPPQQTPPSSHAATAAPFANTPSQTKPSMNSAAASQPAPTTSNLNSTRPAATPSPSTPAPTSATVPAAVPTTPPPVQPLTGSVSFFSRFRSIRNAPDPANRAAGGVLQLGPLLSSPLPAYPADAQRKQIQGVVELDVFVAADGSVQEVHFIKGPAELADAALDAVRGWHYGSTVLGGRPVETEQSIFLTFKLAK
jgi:TonB family protein